MTQLKSDTPSEQSLKKAREIVSDIDCDWTFNGHRRGARAEQDAIDLIARALDAAKAKRIADRLADQFESRTGDRIALAIRDLPENSK